MIIFDQEKLSGFFDMVSRGFQRSPLEIVAMIAAVVVFIVLLIVAYQIQRRRARKRRLTIARTRYARLAAQKGLTPSEQGLVDRLARYLRDPDKKYLLLVGQPTFNYCASRLRGADPSVDAGLSELRLKLGFTISGPEQVPASSAELPDGQAVLLVTAPGRSGRRLQGRVAGRRPSSLSVQLAGSAAPPDRGRTVRVYFQNRSGLFSFDSEVQQYDERTASLDLSHSESIQRIQRRRYYRRRVAFAVSVRRAGTDAEPLPSQLLDISGDGAGLRNPGRRFEPREDVQLEFQAGGEQFSLVGEVLRLSRGGQVMHVRFAPMREAARDRLIGAVAAAPTGGAPGRGAESS